MKRSNVKGTTKQINLKAAADASFVSAAKRNSLLLLLFVNLFVLSACGGGKSSSRSQTSGQIAGNWQFTMASPSDNSYLGGIQGGFLLQNNESLTGEIVYAIFLPP